MLETLAASGVFHSLNNDSLVLRNPGSYPAVAAASLLFFLVNTGGVAMIGLCTGQNGLHVLAENVSVDRALVFCRRVCLRPWRFCCSAATRAIF